MDDSFESEQLSEGLRERKKRLTRQLISDMATAMFLERGFEDVKVAEIADACGVSEKTVFNYFPTKESLLFDNEPELAAAIWRALGPNSTARSPVEGMWSVIEQVESDVVTSRVKDGTDLHRRFAELVMSSPALQDAQRELSDRLERATAEALAASARVSPEDPEPRIAAAALIGLLRLYFDAFRRHSMEELSAREAHRLALDSARRAARVLESGLWFFSPGGETRASRQQFRSAADAAQLAGQQVAAALRQARDAWKQMQRETARHGDDLAALFDQTDWMRADVREQRELWREAYREQQEQLRRTQRELQQHFRQLYKQRQKPRRH